MSMNKLIVLTLFSISGVTSASPSIDIIIPVYTKHIVYSDNLTNASDEPPNEYKETNVGIGINFELERTSFGGMYLKENSLEEESFYAYGSYNHKFGDTSYIGAGVVVATGYEHTFEFVPAVTARYKWVRVATTYPLGKLTGFSPDIITLQLVIPVHY